jgi:hypothetical protein
MIVSLLSSPLPVFRPFSVGLSLRSEFAFKISREGLLFSGAGYAAPVTACRYLGKNGAKRMAFRCGATGMTPRPLQFAERSALRSGHGPTDMFHDVQEKIAFSGVEGLPPFARTPKGIGLSERFSRTLKEGLPWGRTFESAQEPRLVLIAFAQWSKTSTALCLSRPTDS